MNKISFLKLALKSTLIAATTVAILLLGSLLPTPKSTLLEGSKLILAHAQFSDLFFRWHPQTNTPYVDGRKTIVVDINAFDREDLPDLFDSIAKAQPYLVAMDVVYGQYAMTDSAIDKRLKESIKKLPRLILAEEVLTNTKPYQIRRSFFAQEVDAQGACVNLPYSILRYWQKEYRDSIENEQKIRKDTVLPTFAAAIAKELNIDIPDTRSSWMIDYSICETKPLDSQDLKHMNWNYLKDQIIIIGDVGDLRDTYVVPSSFNANMRMSGVMMHNQILQTIMAKRWFHKVSKVWLWIIIFIYLTLYLFGGKFITTYISEHENWKWIERRAKNFYKLTLTCVLIMIAYVVFWCGHAYIDVMAVILTPIMLWLEKTFVSIYDTIVMFINHTFIKKGKKV